MTAKNTPGKHYRKGISLIQALQQFGDDEKAEAWLVSQRWADGITCPYCDSEAVSPVRPPARLPNIVAGTAAKTSLLRPERLCRTPSCP